MHKHILRAFRLNQKLAELLVSDLTAAQMTQQPHGLINHPAWTLGHLVVTGNNICKTLGLESSLPEGWGDKFKAGVTPDPDPAQNPSKEELLEAFRTCHKQLSEALAGISEEELAKKHPNEGTRKYFPTIGDFVVYLMTAHEGDHLGQVAAWRRAMGLGPAM